MTLTSDEISAVLLSAKVAAWATVLICPLAVAFGWLLARKDFFGKGLLDALIHLPLVLPPVVPGYLLLVMFGNQGIAGRWLNENLGVSFAFNWKGAALSSAVMAFPLMVRSMRLSMRLIDPRLEGAARTLGAGPWSVFFSVTFPLALPGVLAGLILGFSRSLGEFGATITFVGNIEGETRTLPLAIYTASHVPGGDAEAMRLIVLSMVLSLSALLASDWLSRRVERRLGMRANDA
jgi:molybdate transport system permease protein